MSEIKTPVPLPTRHPGISISVFPAGEEGYTWHVAYGTQSKWVGASGVRDTVEAAWTAAVAAGNRLLGRNKPDAPMIIAANT